MKTIFILSLITAYLFISLQDYKDQLAIEKERSCIAQKIGERTESVRRGDGSVQCTSYENAGFTRAETTKFVEVWVE